MTTDRELIDKVKHGEQDVYSKLFQKYYGRIYAICLAMLKNPQDAEELAQEVFALAYLKLDQLREPDKFFPWIKKITRNRGKNRMQKAGPRLVPLNLANSRRTSDPPDKWIIRQEWIDSIIEAIKALPARDREVVQARIDGLKHTEISERFGISVQASRSRLSRSRRRLADNIGDMQGIMEFIVWLDRLDADTLEIQSASTDSADSILPEDSQSYSEIGYDKTYDTFIGITKRIDLVRAKIAPLDEELKRCFDEWRRSVRDPENLTEAEKRLTCKMREDARPTLEKRQEMNCHWNYLGDELIKEIRSVVPCAIQASYCRDIPEGRLNVVRIDYDHVRSTLGPLPEEYDAYLAEFFAGFEKYQLSK